jgi:surface carbohydrate biosynthesis protein
MKVRLIIPVESQVREFDAKLLLACIAANQGFISVIGHPKKLKTHIARFPKSIYLAKDIKASRSNMFKIMRKLGYKIVAWDEEALVHLPRICRRTPTSRAGSLQRQYNTYPIYLHGEAKMPNCGLDMNICRAKRPFTSPGIHAVTC